MKYANDNYAASLEEAATTQLPARFLYGDALNTLKSLGDNSLDSCVTDPPYGIEFMNKSWDHPENIAFSAGLWREVLRVLKPGAYLLAFSAPRTYHRMVIAIEDAGFDICDQIAWLYGTGMPKSRNLSKDIDAKLGAKREVVGKHNRIGYTRLQQAHGVQTVNVTEFAKLSDEPVTPQAAEWDGWSTALKPAMEPIVVAQKPFKGSYATNVLKHGVGGMNIDACRVGTEGATTRSHQAAYPENSDGTKDRTNWARSGHDVVELAKGRWPANVIHDGSPDVAASFPGGQQRFFYCPKPSKREKGDTSHVTVKPVKLMKYLCRLVTPPGGMVLDPFAGSGTTGVAALAEGFVPVLIEREAQYLADIERRTGLKAA